jgi:hypothetical protein
MFNRLTGRLSWPSPAMVVAVAALVAVLGGTAYASSSTGNGRSRPATATANVTSGGVAPNAFYHQSTTILGSCTPIATAPAKKGLVVTDVELNIYADPSPGPGNNVLLSTGAGCTTLVGDVNPASIGETDFSFGPGLALAAGQSLYASQELQVAGETYVNGYTVASSEVTATPTMAGHPGVPPQDH